MFKNIIKHQLMIKLMSIHFIGRNDQQARRSSSETGRSQQSDKQHRRFHSAIIIGAENWRSTNRLENNRPRSKFHKPIQLTSQPAVAQTWISQAQKGRSNLTEKADTNNQRRGHSGWELHQQWQRIGFHRPPTASQTRSQNVRRFRIRRNRRKEKISR